MPEKDPRVRVHIGMRIFRFPMFEKDVRHNRENCVHNLKERVVGHVLHGKLALAGIARISPTQDSVTISRNNFA